MNLFICTGEGWLSGIGCVTHDYYVQHMINKIVNKGFSIHSVEKTKSKIPFFREAETRIWYH